MREEGLFAIFIEKGIFILPPISLIGRTKARLKSKDNPKDNKTKVK